MVSGLSFLEEAQSLTSKTALNCPSLSHRRAVLCPSTQPSSRLGGVKRAGNMRLILISGVQYHVISNAPLVRFCRR